MSILLVFNTLFLHYESSILIINSKLQSLSDELQNIGYFSITDHNVRFAYCLSNFATEQKNIVLEGINNIDNDIYSVTPRLIKYEENTYIVYPHIVFKYDRQLENDINSIIVNKILCKYGTVSELFYNSYVRNYITNTADEVMTYLEYEITYSSPDILSIRFYGVYIDFITKDYSILSFVDRFSNSDYYVMPTIVIDMKNGLELKLSDIINIDNEFKKQMDNVLSKYLIDNLYTVGVLQNTENYSGIYLSEYIGFCITEHGILICRNDMQRPLYPLVEIIYLDKYQIKNHLLIDNLFNE